MCNKSCYEFGENHLDAGDVRNKKVLEIGARDVNGSLRQTLEKLEPASYLGIDIEDGPGVDEICSVYDVVDRYGENSFDLVVSTEMLEHVRDWRVAISQFKRVVKPFGVVLITTRSKGFGYHEYPGDFWRFEVEDMKNIFSDMQIEALEPDATEPGVFIKVRKPESFVEKKLDEIELYSMVRQKRCKKLSSFDLLYFKFDNAVIQRVKNSFNYRVRGHKTN